MISTGREDVLVEEFPSYLREAVFGWMEGAVGADRGWVHASKFIAFQNAARIDIGFTAGSYMKWRETILPHLRKINDSDFTNLVDFLLSVQYQSSGLVHPLERILSDGGSAWTVIPWVGQKARLTKRVPDGIRKSLDNVLSAKDTASQKLQEAWIDAYGTNPRASVAYSHAVVAVETAALGIITVNTKDATLGNLFAILESETPKWKLILRDNDKAPGAKSLAAMLRTLWRGHESRHGRSDYEDATLDEARAAVILAATLVQWFTSGVVVPVESTN